MQVVDDGAVQISQYQVTRSTAFGCLVLRQRLAYLFLKSYIRCVGDLDGLNSAECGQAETAPQVDGRTHYGWGLWSVLHCPLIGP